MQYSDRENRINNSIDHSIKDRLILLIFLNWSVICR